MLAITTYCTQNYTYALRAQMPLVTSALRYAGTTGALFIMAGDDSDEVAKAAREYEKHLDPLHIPFERIVLEGLTDNGNEAHNKKGNLVIARMMTAAWNMARCRGADMLWSLESDILPEPKTLRTMMGVLSLDPGWYDVCMATYPNTGFLGGRGTPYRWILPSIYPEERVITPEIQARIDAKKAREDELAQKKEQPTEADLKEWRDLDKAIDALPPKGNVWKLNGEQWRPRGWLDHAYPGIGIGAVLPTDWVGLGCTLMTRRALDLAHFTGYDGGCTEDLWLCWRAWHPARLNLAVTTHAICSHVKQKIIPAKGKEPEKKEHIIHYARHELGGEHHGHLRVESRVWDGL